MDVAVELARRVPELQTIEQVSRDRKWRDEVARWLSVLARMFR
jgi:hypothetical protein